MLHKMVLLKDVPKLAGLASNAKIGTAYSRAIWPNGQKWNWEYPESHVALLYLTFSSFLPLLDQNRRSISSDESEKAKSVFIFRSLKKTNFAKTISVTNDLTSRLLSQSAKNWVDNKK